MSAPPPVIVSWSGGKDSAAALHVMRRDGTFTPVALLTTVTGGYERVSIHGIRRDVLQAQAAALGLPVFEAVIPANAGNAAYEDAFAAALASLATVFPACRHIAFGDLFLADVREYRERLLAATGWAPVFPVWGRDTTAFAHWLIASGFRTRLCCVDTTALDGAFAGAEFDADLLARLPEAVDPCGERGEFHTCVYDMPDFAAPLVLHAGDTVLRDGRFMYRDLLAERA